MKETIKKTCLLLLLFIAINHSFAQSEKNYYAENLKGIFKSNMYPRVLTVETIRNIARLKVYDPVTQELLGTIRLKSYEEAYPSHFVYDSSFALIIKSVGGLSFDSHTNTLTVSDSTGLKLHEYEYIKGAKHNRCIKRSFYNNGRVATVEIYEKKDVYLEDYGTDALFSFLQPLRHDNIVVKIAITAYYYNGQKYYSHDWQRVVTDNTQSFCPRNLEMYDSTGKKLNAADYLAEESSAWANEKGVWYQYHNTGNIACIKDFTSKCWAITYYEEDGKTIAFFNFYPMYEGQKGIILKSSKVKQSMFSKETEQIYYKELSSGVVKSKTRESTPLWEFWKDPKTKDYGQTIYAASPYDSNDLSWSSQTCPPTPAYLHEGSYDGSLPDGEHRLYEVDSVGKKKHLLALQTFKKGILEGKIIRLDADNDTLASGFYKNGNLIYNKYYKPYFKQYFPYEYAIDSVKALKKAVEGRAESQHLKQHAQYEESKQDGTVALPNWQCDTIVWVNVSNYNAIKSLTTTFVIKEQLSPEANSPIRVRYTTDSGKTYILRYNKLTKQLDSTFTVIDNKGEIVSLYDPIKHSFYENSWSLLSFKQSLTPNLFRVTNPGWEWEMPSDSVCIVSLYSNRILCVQRVIDSFYQTPSFRKKMENKLYPIEKLNLYFEDTTTNFKRTPPVLFDINSELLNPIHSETVYNYDGEYRLYSSGTGKNYLQYDEKGNILPKNKQGFYSSKTTYLENTKIRQTYNEKQEIEQETTEYLENLANINELHPKITEKVVKYRNGKPIRIDLYYNRTFLKNTASIDTLTNIVTDSLYNDDKTLLSVFKKQIVYRLLTTKTRSAIEPVSIPISLQRFYIDKDKNSFQLALDLQRQADSSYLAHSWYYSGKPNIVFAHYASIGNCAPYFVNQNSLYPIIMSSNFPYNELETTDAALVYWENGGLKLQGKWVGKTYLYGEPYLVYCEYDEMGKIKKEVLDDNFTFKYPDATNTADCAWQNLPYQEGKMQNNKRVGEWRGYYRRSKKQLQYIINYDNEGALDGEIRIYDTLGNLIHSKNFKKNKLIGNVNDFYANGNLFKCNSYNTFGTQASTKLYALNGALLKEVVRNPREETHYDAQTQEVIKHEINIGDGSIDSIFDKHHKLLQATAKYAHCEIGTTRDSVGILHTITSKYGTIIAASTKEYELFNQNHLAEELEEELEEAIGLDTVFKARPLHSVWLKRLKLLKKVHIAAASFEKEQTLKRGRIFRGYFEDSNDNGIYRKTLETYLDTFLIRDSLGHQFIFTQKGNAICVLLKADSLPTPDYNDPIALKTGCCTHHNLPKNSNKESVFNTKTQDASVNLQVMEAKTSLRFPATILHPIDTPKKGAEIQVSASIKLAKTHPHRFAQEGDIRYWQTNLSKKEIAKIVAKLPCREEELFNASLYLHATQAYEIAQTGIQITPFSAQLTLGLPAAIENSSANDNFNISNLLAPMYFPFHQTISETGELKSDNYLTRSEIRLLLTGAEMTWPIAHLSKELQTENVLISDKEINGLFYLTDEDAKNETLIAAIKRYCGQKGIDFFVYDKAFAKKHPNFTPNIAINDGALACFFRIRL